MSTYPIIVPTLSEPPTEEAVTIHPAELAYHVKVIQRVQAISALQAQIEQYQAQIAQYQQEILTTQAIRDFWIGHLSERYHLQPGEGVDNLGRILRAAPPEGG